MASGSGPVQGAACPGPVPVSQRECDEKDRVREMAYSINRVVVSGNLVRDPEVRYTSQGKACARLTVALDRGRSAQGDELGADYPQAVFWGGLAESIERYCRKGMLVTIEGRLRTGSYDNRQTGQKVYFTEIAGDKIAFHRQRDEEKDRKAEFKEAPSAADVTGSDDWSSQMSMEGFSRADDIPF